MEQIRLRGLQALCETLQRNLWSAVQFASPIIQTDGLEQMRARLQQTEQQVLSLCQRHKLTPAHLPARSRQLYAWLRFVSQPNAFAAHVGTLRRVGQLLPAVQSGRLSKALPEPPTVHIELSNSGYLYRAQRDPQHKHGLKIQLNEGFCGAPEPILDLLLQLSFGRKRHGLPNIKAYAHSKPYLDIMLAMQLEVPEQPPTVAGQHYDLQQVFDRVNARFFDGQIARPHLRWSSGVTERVMGSYQQRSDTVMLSQTLDHPQVPEYVIDFVMYHELLHKQLGSQLRNGRRRVHFAEFRAAEQRYPRFAEAESFLNAWSKRRRGLTSA